MNAQQDNPFLTIVAFPEGADRTELAEILAVAADLDEPTMRLRLGQAPPLIVGQFETRRAQEAARAVIDFGGDAFIFTIDDLARLGPTLKIRDLRLVDGALEIDLWRGPSTTIRREQIQILIRARLSEKMVKAAAAGRDGFNPRFIGPGVALAGGGWAFAGTYGLAGVMSAMMEGAARPDREITTSDKLDIHTTDGFVYQIDGDKFGYRILGSLRTHGDKANMDAMCELLTHLAPQPIVDHFFPLWLPPPAHDRLRLPGHRVDKEDPAFAFYSRWAALVYRRVLHG